MKLGYFDGVCTFKSSNKNVAMTKPAIPRKKRIASLGRKFSFQEITKRSKLVFHFHFQVSRISNLILSDAEFALEKQDNKKYS